MPPSQNSPHPEETDLHTAITERTTGIESGGYRANTEHILTEFRTWLHANRDVTTLDELTPTDCRRYAQHPRDRAHNDDYDFSASSANTYYAYVRAFLGWCVRDGRIDTNPAARNTATEELPDDADRPERQFWTERDRNAIPMFVDKRLDALFDDDSEIDQDRAYHDRALVSLLALSGVRGAEVFNAPADEWRNGLRWSDVDLENGTLECSESHASINISRFLNGYAWPWSGTNGSLSRRQRMHSCSPPGMLLRSMPLFAINSTIVRNSSKTPMLMN